jgi:hypothetical protein
MSYDLNLATVCNHRIYKEPITLESDRRTLRLSKPLASSNIDLYASDDQVAKASYIIIYDSSQPDQSNLSRMIVLKDKWKSTEDYFEASYVTINNYCPKCAGLGNIDDIGYDTKGNLLLNRNEKLLLQNVEKYTVTEVQSNPFHLFIGTSLVSLLGQKISNQTYITTKIIQEISSTLQVLKDMQKQYMAAGRTMTPGEILDVVESVKVLFDTNDPTILRADVAVRALSGRTVNYSQFMKIS